MTFAGVIIQGGSVSSMKNVSGDYYSTETLCNCDFISFNYNFAGGKECSIVDKSGCKVASIKLSGTNARAAMFKDNVEVSGSNMATAVTPGGYQVIFRLVDNSIQFFFGSASATINTVSTQSNLRLKATSANFALVRGL